MTVASPRLGDALVVPWLPAHRAPPPHTGAEVDALIDLARRRRARTVTLGHGRNPRSAAAAAAVGAAWTAAGGVVLDAGSWPEHAASWLRQAERFTSGCPDLRVMARTSAGWAQTADWYTRRRACDTLAFASLASPTTIGLAGPDVVDGLGGTTGDGAHWCVVGDEVVRLPLDHAPGREAW